MKGCKRTFITLSSYEIAKLYDDITTIKVKNSEISLGKNTILNMLVISYDLTDSYKDYITILYIVDKIVDVIKKYKHLADISERTYIMKNVCNIYIRIHNHKDIEDNLVDNLVNYIIHTMELH